MDKLENAIKEIICGITVGKYFDVHTIISILIQKYHDTYLLSTGNYSATDQYHSKISQLINANTNSIECVGKAYSKNVHDNYSECNLYKRI